MVERAGISNGRAVGGDGARDDPFSVEIGEPMPDPSLPTPASFMITARTGHLAALKAL